MTGPKKVAGDAGAGMLDACKLQFETGVALVNALVAGSERMREMQLAAARDTEAQHREIVEQMSKARSLQDLAEMQTRLANVYAQGAMSYWSKVATLAQQTQAEVSKLVQEECAGALAATPAAGGTPAPSAAEFASVVESTLASARRANEAFLEAWTRAAAPSGQRGPTSTPNRKA